MLVSKYASPSAEGVVCPTSRAGRKYTETLSTSPRFLSISPDGIGRLAFRERSRVLTLALPLIPLRGPPIALYLPNMPGMGRYHEHRRIRGGSLPHSLDHVGGR